MKSCSAEDVFKMATINPNNVIGKNINIGCIKEGFSADLVFIEKNNTRLMPVINNSHFSNILHNILLECRQDMIRHVMINGSWVLRDGNITTIDEAELNTRYRSLAEKLVRAWEETCQ
jgi:5-methylthioadenosine/S-adenosylhomocysteine deaminase